LRIFTSTCIWPQLLEYAHRFKSWLAGEAIKQNLDLEAWQIGGIAQALKEAGAYSSIGQYLFVLL
jgi:hypothetical protein